MVILEPPKIKSLTVSIVSPFICHEVMGPDAMMFVFRMLSFKPAFSLSSFTFIKRLFSSSLLSSMRVASSAYLRLFIFLPAILIRAFVSSSHIKIYTIYSNEVFEVVGSESINLFNYFGKSHILTAGSEVKASACNVGRLGFDPWVGKIPWIRKWQPTPVLLPGESHGRRSLVGYSPRSCKELTVTE